MMINKRGSRSALWGFTGVCDTQAGGLWLYNAIKSVEIITHYY